jgi:hypothetical protein
MRMTKMFFKTPIIVRQRTVVTTKKTGIICMVTRIYEISELNCILSGAVKFPNLRLFWSVLVQDIHPYIQWSLM